jgi:hypothetical protein
MDSKAKSDVSGKGVMPATVLVGFAEALAAPEVVWSLVDAGFHVIAFARKGKRSALHHSHHVVCHEITPPEVDLQAALSDLRDLVTSLNATEDGAPRVLFPLDDTAVALSTMVQLGLPWLMAGPQGAGAELALNKCVQTQAARDAGFNVPLTAIARTADDLYTFIAAESFPIILKPAECVPIRQGRVVGCRKWICANRSELEHVITEWAERIPLLAQPFLAGTGEGIFGLATPDGIMAWSAHRRLRMMNPQGSGSSACVSQAVPSELRSQAEELITKAKWRGLFMIELLRNEAGNTWFMELNGRPWGSMALSRRQGFEYPAWHVKLAIDRNSHLDTAVSPTPGMVCRHVGREFMHLLFVLRGPKSKALTRWPSFWNTLANVLRVHRADTVYNWRPEDRKVFLADCYYTVHGNLFKPRN